jgi:hypothetical protein
MTVVLLIVTVVLIIITVVIVFTTVVIIIIATVVLLIFETQSARDCRFRITAVVIEISPFFY